MKLLFVIDVFGLGGKERRCLQLIKGLNQLGVRNIHLIIIDNIVGYPEIYKLDVQVHILDRKRRMELSIPWRIYKLIRDIKPDVVLSWSLMSSFWVSLLRIVHRFNVIHAYVTNNRKPVRYSVGNLTRRLSLLHSAWIVGNSAIGLQTYQIPERKAQLIYNGFDFSRIERLKDPQSVRQEFAVKTEYMICMIGRMTTAKDFQTYINAARLVHEENKEVTFLAVGSGPLLEQFSEQLTRQETRYIIFTDQRADIEDIIHATDISVLCSPSEGISNVILESMALGKPVIATATGGTPEIVEDGITGYLYRHQDSVQLKELILDLLSDRDKRIRFGANGRKSAQTKFSLEEMTHRFYALFTQLGC